MPTKKGNGDDDGTFNEHKNATTETLFYETNNSSYPEQQLLQLYI